jgi:hypothetical protein
MIRRIGVIYQDATSLGLLIGLQQRLGCSAEIVEPTASIGRSTNMNRRQATLAWQQFYSRGAELIIRLTDADGNRWQDVKRYELDVFPPASRSILICGVCDRNVESWLTACAPAFATWVGKSVADVLIVLRQPVNTRFLGGVNPAKAAMVQGARRAGLSAMSMKRLAAKQQRYVLTEIPGQAAAQDAEMSLTDYEDFVFRAGFLHLPDPVAAWRALHDQQQRAIGYLQSKKILRFQSPANGGTDVTVDVSDRTWLNRADGENFPDGELDSGPRRVDGVVNLTHPSVYKGKQVDGIRRPATPTNRAFIGIW